MKRLLRTASFGAIAALSIVLAQCSGSGGNASSTPPTSRPTVSPTIGPSSTPTTAPTITPTTHPTSSPTPRPTPTPTPRPTPTPTSSPTTAPTPTPTPTATPGTIVLSPLQVVVSAQGTGCTTSVNFTASEAGFTGTFTGHVANPSIATLASNTSTGTFTVNSVTTTNGGVGTTITVTDGRGGSAVETVTIATCLP